jgi:hypothetical protein
MALCLWENKEYNKQTTFSQGKPGGWEEWSHESWPPGECVPVSISGRSEIFVLFLVKSAMQKGLVFVTCSLLVLPGCIPLYVAGAKIAVSTVSAVASGVGGGGTDAVAMPQDRGKLLEMYTGCLKQKNNNPGVDCTKYRIALEASTK